MWKTVNPLIGKTNQTTSVKQLIAEDTEKTRDPNEMATLDTKNNLTKRKNKCVRLVLVKMKLKNSPHL